jgi:hypothetical protein
MQELAPALAATRADLAKLGLEDIVSHCVLHDPSATIGTIQGKGS